MNLRICKVLIVALLTASATGVGAATVGIPPKIGSQPASAAPPATQTAPKVTMPGVTGPQPTGKSIQPVPQGLVGPTQNITAVANSIRVQYKSLTVFITTNPGLPLTQPVTISIRFDGYDHVRYSAQDYGASNGNQFLYHDPEGDGKPRQAFVSITLTEPKPGGGVYSYSIPQNFVLDPLYNLDVGGLAFSLIDDCSNVGTGSKEITFHWKNPADYDGSFTGDASPGQLIPMGKFAWSAGEVNGQSPLHFPVFAFETSQLNICPWCDVGPLFWDSFPRVPIVPGNAPHVSGKPEIVKGNLTAINDKGCRAYFEYPITYTLRSYFVSVRDHR